jgi:hypothetical protein
MHNFTAIIFWTLSIVPIFFNHYVSRDGSSLVFRDEMHNFILHFLKLCRSLIDMNIEYHSRDKLFRSEDLFKYCLLVCTWDTQLHFNIIIVSYKFRSLNYVTVF